MKFLKNEEIEASGEIYPIKIKDKEGSKEKICDVTVHLDQLDTSTQSTICIRQEQAALSVQKRIDLTIYLLRNVINKINIGGETFYRTAADDKKTLRHIAEKSDISDNDTGAVFLGIIPIVMKAITINEDSKKKSEGQASHTDQQNAA